MKRNVKNDLEWERAGRSDSGAEGDEKREKENVKNDLKGKGQATEGERRGGERREDVAG